LVDLLTIAANIEPVAKPIDKYADDSTGNDTVEVLYRSLDVVSRITGSSDGSLGLHTAVYFYTDKGKHSKFLFLGIVALIAEKLRNNDAYFFKKFTKARPSVEEFLIENKSLIGIILQNLGKNQRIPKVREMFDFLVSETVKGAPLEVEKVIAQLGLTGRIVDVRPIQTTPAVTDETKNTIIIKTAIATAPKCPLCYGRLEPNKSRSYDHITDKKHEGTGDVDNIQLTHPYCNNQQQGHSTTMRRNETFGPSTETSLTLWTSQMWPEACPSRSGIVTVSFRSPAIQNQPSEIPARPFSNRLGEGEV